MATQKQNTVVKTENENAREVMNNQSPMNHLIDKTYEGISSFCRENPKTSKRIAGTLMVGVGIGSAVGGAVLIRSTF